jgi:hypothetical protein
MGFTRDEMLQLLNAFSFIPGREAQRLYRRISNAYFDRHGQPPATVLVTRLPEALEAIAIEPEQEEAHG